MCAAVYARAVQEGPYLSSRRREGLASVACEALALFAINPASHRSLQVPGVPLHSLGNVCLVLWVL